MSRSKDKREPTTGRTEAKRIEPSELSELFDLFSLLCGFGPRTGTETPTPHAAKQKQPRRSLRANTGGRT